MSTILRLTLCAALLSVNSPAFAQETFADESAAQDAAAKVTPLLHCVSQEILAGEFDAPDADIAEEAGGQRPAKPGKPMSLSSRRDNLSRVARLLEFFQGRDAISDKAIKDAFAKTMLASHLKFFSSRRRLLNTTYRTLAVIDYTFATKQAGACAGGLKYRRDMIYAKDGLFVDPKTGRFSPWLERLTGKKGGSVPATAAVDEAGPSQGGRSVEASYQLLLNSQRRLTRQLDAERDAKKRAALMCQRARGYRILALGALLQKPVVSQESAFEEAAAMDQSEQGENEEGSLEASADGDSSHEDAAEPVTEAAWMLSSKSAGLSVRELYKQVAPSVVAIRSNSPAAGGSFGTGSVVSTKGEWRILTNAHVVWNKQQNRPHENIIVYFKPANLTGDRAIDLQRGVQAKLLRFNRSKDLALLSLPSGPQGVRPISFGDDSAVQIGDPVLAIGHPEEGGLWTLTQGLVSTVKANLTGVKGKDAFQTDASINRGNSGGPLLDTKGRQIGINTLIARKAKDGMTITAVNFSLKIGFAKRWLSESEKGASEDAAAEASAEDQDVAQAASDAEVAEDLGDDEAGGDGSILTVARPFSLDDAASDSDSSDDLAAAADEENQEAASDSAKTKRRAAPAPAKLGAQRCFTGNGEIWVPTIASNRRPRRP